jgi:hypothetical protein
MTPGTPKVDNYVPRIFAKWNELADKAKVEKPDAFNIREPHLIERKSVADVVIRSELQKVREEFLIEARKLEQDRMEVLEAQLRKKIEIELRDRESQMVRAYRIINIQNAIISRLYAENRDILLKVLQEADITEDDLRVLSSGYEEDDSDE